MKWEDDVIKTKDESEPKLNNKCTLVWEVINCCNFYSELITCSITNFIVKTMCCIVY